MLAEVGQLVAGWLEQLAPARGTLGEHDTPYDHVFFQWMHYTRTGQMMAHSGAASLAWAARWQAHGRPTFALTESLLAKLLLTDPGDVPANEARPPFPAFLVEIPPGYLSYDDEDGRERPIAYVSFHSMPNSTAIEIQDEIDMPPEPRRLLERMRTLQKQKREYLAATTGQIWSFSGMGRTHTEPIIHERIFAPDPHEPLGPWVHVPPSSDLLGQTVALSDRETKTMAAAKILLVNLCLYLGSLPKIPKPRVTKAKPHKGRAGGIRVYDLGRTVKLSAELRAAAKDLGAHAPSAGWKLRARFTVRGHWRNQACGPGRTQRKRIWIDPHWKGPKVGDQISRDYETSV